MKKLKVVRQLCYGSGCGFFMVMMCFRLKLSCVSRPAAVNCPLPKPPTGGKIVHDKAVTGATVKYGHSWTYECAPPKAPSHERGSCQADGTATEPPVCQGNCPHSYPFNSLFDSCCQSTPICFDCSRGKLPHPDRDPQRLHHLCRDERARI